jgi:hypothetical protein
VIHRVITSDGVSAGGGISNDLVTNAHRALGPCLSGPVQSLPLQQTHFVGGSLPPQANHTVSNSFITDKAKRGRTKTTSKKANPFPPGNFLYKFHEARKGGHKPKKKKVSRGTLFQQPSSSKESDPIEVSEEVSQRNHFCNFEGIDLEVVLPHSCDGVRAGGLPILCARLSAVWGVGIRVWAEFLACRCH